MWECAVTGVTPANADTGAKRSITMSVDKYWDSILNSAATFETEDFAFGDVVLVTLADGAVKSVTAPGVVTGTPPKSTSAGVYTINGAEYKLSQLNGFKQGAPVSLSLGTSGSWYTDTMGNIIGVKATAAAPWSYGYLVGYAKSDNNPADLLGTGATVAAEKIQLITSAGEKVVLDGAFTLNTATNTVDTYVGANQATSGNNVVPALVRYQLNAAGKVAVIENVAASGNAVTGMSANSQLTATKGEATLGGKYVTDNTVFFAYKDATEYAVYTGYKNIPATLTGSKYRAFYAVKADGTVDTNTLAAVYLQVADATAQTAANYVYFASAANTTETTAEGTVVTYTNVYLNGVKGELKFQTSAPAYIAAGDLYKYVTDTTTGYATLVKIDGTTSTSANTDRVGRLSTANVVSSIQSGYFVVTLTSNNSTAVEYVGANTAYYQVDATTGAVTLATGLTALNDAYDVKVLYSDSTSSTVPATVVYFTVVAK